MIRKHIIVVTSPEVAAYGNFKRLCEDRGMPYHKLKARRFPIEHEGTVIHKVPYIQSQQGNEKADEVETCDCGAPVDYRYSPCCSYACWTRKFEGHDTE